MVSGLTFVFPDIKKQESRSFHSHHQHHGGTCGVTVIIKENRHVDMRLFAFHVVVILLRKVCIQLFTFQLWIKIVRQTECFNLGMVTYLGEEIVLFSELEHVGVIH